MSKESKILEQIAKKNGVPVEDVRKEIEMAIAAAQNNPDPEVQKEWSKMKFKNDTPTPEEFIKYMAKRVRNGK